MYRTFICEPRAADLLTVIEEKAHLKKNMILGVEFGTPRDQTAQLQHEAVQLEVHAVLAVQPERYAATRLRRALWDHSQQLRGDCRLQSGAPVHAAVSCL